MSNNSESSGYDDLFFREVISSHADPKHNPRFQRRDWLADEVGNLLKKPNARFILLTAEPGFGKSVFMAQLAHDHPEWPRYFIRRDQRELLAGVGSRSFLLRIGYQLAALYPQLFERDALQIAVEQRVGDVEDKGEVIGAEVAKIIASPFYKQGVIKIIQHIDKVSGKVVGLHLDELVIEPRQIEIEDLMHMALVDPARASQQLHPGRQIVILVDALDEVRYQKVEDNILTWLTSCPDLPDNIRFVLTARPPDGDVQYFVDKQRSRAQRLSLEGELDDAFRSHIDKEVSTYVDGLLKDPRVRTLLEKQTDGVSPVREEQTAKAEDKEKQTDGVNNFRKQVIKKADGNLGFLDALARGIDQAKMQKDDEMLRELLTRQDLPDGMKGLYAFFLHQIKSKRVGDTKVLVTIPDSGAQDLVPMWSAVYYPMLAVLAVALEPITLEQIKKLGSILVEWSDLNMAKDNLLQFLDIVDNRYRLYHATLPEFLTGSQTKYDHDTQDLYIDAAQWHKHIIASFRDGAETWQEVAWDAIDDYGLRYLGEHLFALSENKTYRQLLHDLVQTEQFAQAQLDRWHSPRFTLSDLQLALDVALEKENLGLSWKHMNRYRDIQYQERATRRIAERVQEGDYDVALEITSLYGYMPASQALMRLWIAWKAAVEQRPEAAKAAQLALDGLPSRDSLLQKFKRPDSLAYGVEESTDALTEAFIRMLILVTRTAASTKEACHAWLPHATSDWSKYIKLQAEKRMSEEVSAWGDFFSVYGDSEPMDSLLENLEEKFRRAESPQLFRDASFEFHRPLSAGLYFSRNAHQWQEYVEKTVELISMDEYPSYREMALAWVATAVLAHSDEVEAMDALMTILSGALDKSEHRFWVDTSAVVLDGWAAENGFETSADDLYNQLVEIEFEHLRKVDPSLPVKTSEYLKKCQQQGIRWDPWAQDIRRRNAIGAVLYRHNREKEAKIQLHKAAGQHRSESYAGYRVLARLSLTCRWLEWGNRNCAEESLILARGDAQNMLDKVLSRERSDLIDDLESWLSKAENSWQGDDGEERALRQFQNYTGMKRSLLIEFLSAIWYPNADLLKRLAPYAAGDTTAADAVLGRLMGALDLQAAEGISFADLAVDLGLNES